MNVNLEMETIQQKIRRSLRILLQPPIDIENLYEFMCVNKSWICGWNEYHKSVQLLHDHGKNVSVITEYSYPEYSVQRYNKDNIHHLSTTIMFSQIEGYKIPQFHLLWDELLYIDWYEMGIELDDGRDIDAIAVVSSYRNDINELLFIEVPDKFRNRGYGSLLLSEIRKIVARDIILYSISEAESFYSKHGGILTNEWKEFKEGKLRKIILPALSPT